MLHPLSHLEQDVRVQGRPLGPLPASHIPRLADSVPELNSGSRAEPLRCYNSSVMGHECTNGKQVVSVHTEVKVQHTHWIRGQSTSWVRYGVTLPNMYTIRNAPFQLYN